MNRSKASIQSLPHLVSAEDLAALVSISYRSILRWIKEGKIPRYRLKKLVQFDVAEVWEWLKEKSRKP